MIPEISFKSMSKEKSISTYIMAVQHVPLGALSGAQSMKYGLLKLLVTC